MDSMDSIDVPRRQAARVAAVLVFVVGTIVMAGVLTWDKWGGSLIRQLPAFGATPTIGSTVRQTPWAVTVESVEKADRLSGLNGRMETNAGYTFLIVRVSVSNISGSDQTFSTQSLTVVDSQKRVFTCQAVGIGQAVLAGSGDAFQPGSATVSLPPGAGSHDDSLLPPTSVAFVVPEDATGLQFHFEDMRAIDLGQ